MKPVVYKIVNLVNDKFYVGSTTNKKVRFREHRKQLRGSRHHCKHLQAAWNLYGESKFDFVVVEEVADSKDLAAAEDAWLQENVGKAHCYNSGYAAVAPWRGIPKEQHPAFGVPKSEEQREAISKTLKDFYATAPENHPRYGKQHTEETKAKISVSKRANPTRYWEGKERSEETKAKISEAQKGVTKPGRTYTPEGLEKARETMRKNAREQTPLGFSVVLAKFPEEVQGRYDFSAAVYTGALERIQNVVCPTHGVFSQYAAQFRKGRGCPECGAVQRAVSKKKQMLEAWTDPAQRAAFMTARKKPLAPPE